MAARLRDAIRGGDGAAVMGTGIVSVGLALDAQQTLSKVLFGIAVAIWFGVVVGLVRSWIWERRRWLADARRPAALTAVAGTAVVGDRLTLLGEDWAGYVMLVVALCLWLALLPRVLRHWATPTVGVSFLVVVATEALAILAALLAIHDRLAWLTVAALAPLALGLAAYVFVLARVDPRQLIVGRGDHWIFGGALAIATLAAARTSAALAASRLHAGVSAFHAATLALWVVAVAWLPALVGGELIAPRLGFDTRRWSTVFPLGMYAVCSMAAGSVTGIGDLRDFGRVVIWIALGVWAIVFAGSVRRLVEQ
jgi:tellurite resistance protein TehA-like permease